MDENNSAKEFDTMPQQLFYSSLYPILEWFQGLLWEINLHLLLHFHKYDAAKCIIWSDGQSWVGYAWILFIVN